MQKGREKMRYRWKRIFTALCLALALGVAGCREKAALYDSAGESAEAEKAEDTVRADGEGEGSPEEEAQARSVFVYVCGEVVSPGVYELLEGARIADAVEAAGGMTEAASRTYLNLAELVSDGQKIEVPSKEQETALTEERLAKEAGLVNLNTATEQELMTLSGIGEAKAREIVSYREEHGGFSSAEELMEIPGIKEGVFNKIKDQITV